MNVDPYTYLKSEEQEVTRILGRLPEERWIERKSFEGRLKSIRAKLESMEPTKLRRTASLTFRGDPVRGSEAISADFASKVTNFFNDAVTSIAASLNDRLGHMGRIPDKQGKQLYITGTALGSFGFEFELPDHEDSRKDENEASTEDALETLIKIFRVGVVGDDEELGTIVDQIHPRAAAKVSEMLDFMERENAYCGLSCGDEQFGFKHFDELKKAAAAVKSDRIVKGTEVYEGEFTGSLPQNREFEFKPDDGSNSWKGRIGAEIDEPEKLKPYLFCKIKVEFAFTKVGHARPRYTLTDLKKIQLIDTE